MKSIFLFLALHLAAGQAFGAAFVMPPSAGVGGAASASTNSFTSSGGTLYGKGLLNQDNVFWDDFDGPTMKSVEFLQRRSPSGHQYGLTQGGGNAGTNGLLMTGGRWTQTNSDNDAIYLGVTNTGARAWNRIGGVGRFKVNGPITGPFGLPAILNSQLFEFTTGAPLDFLHTLVQLDSSLTVSRGLSDFIMSGDVGDGGLYTRDQVYYEISFFTNLFVMEVNGVFRGVYHTNLNFAFLVKCPIWEILQSGTNYVTWEWESIWAGYANPAVETWGLQFFNLTPSKLIPGVGGALTNVTLLASDPHCVVNGFTNVSIRAVMGTALATIPTQTGLRNRQRLVITNGSGSNRALEFSQVTNAWRFTGTYGSNAPNTLTNLTKFVADLECDGTNVLVDYKYVTWP